MGKDNNQCLIIQKCNAYFVLLTLLLFIWCAIEEHETKQVVDCFVWGFSLTIIINHFVGLWDLITLCKIYQAFRNIQLITLKFSFLGLFIVYKNIWHKNWRFTWASDFHFDSFLSYQVEANFRGIWTANLSRILVFGKCYAHAGIFQELNQFKAKDSMIQLSLRF